MVLGRAYQPSERQPIDLACHHLKTIWQEKMTRETSQAVERRPGQILERHDLAEESTRGHYGCLMMMMIILIMQWCVLDGGSPLQCVSPGRDLF